MTALLLLSIALLLVAIGGSLVLIARSGETRVGWLTAAFLALAMQQTFTLWLSWGQPLSLDAAGIGELIGLVASAFSLVVLSALWRTVGERDRAESLHWTGMEVVRSLGELSTQPELGFDDKLASILEMGTHRFGLEIGMVSRVAKGRYEVMAVRAPDGFPVARGAVFSLAETCCGPTLESDRPIGFERLDDSRLPQPERAAFGYQSYLGAAIRADDHVYGTLSFGSLRPRSTRITATEKDLVNLMAKWIAGELERRGAIPRSANAPQAAAAGSGWREVRVPRGVDLNAVLRRLEKRLRSLAEPGVELRVRLAGDLEPAHAPRVPLETIIRSLVTHALDAMPDGGQLVIETRNLEVTRVEPGIFPAVAPDRYVTLAVSDTGASVDADAVSHVFEEDTDENETGSEEGRLPLASVYRILQRCGGDLSVDVEPGRGSTFTIFLPLASSKARARSQTQPTTGPAASLPPPPPTSDS